MFVYITFLFGLPLARKISLPLSRSNFTRFRLMSWQEARPLTPTSSKFMEVYIKHKTFSRCRSRIRKRIKTFHQNKKTISNIPSESEKPTEKSDFRSESPNLIYTSANGGNLDQACGDLLSHSPSFPSKRHLI